MAKKIKPALTLREIDVALGIAQGLNYPAIGVQLKLGHETVRTHVNSLRDKTGLRTKSALAIWASNLDDWLRKTQIKLQRQKAEDYRG